MRDRSNEEWNQRPWSRRFKIIYASMWITWVVTLGALFVTRDCWGGFTWMK